MISRDFASVSKAMAGVASFMAVLLFGIAIGLYSSDFWGEQEAPRATEDTARQSHEEGLSRPVLHLDPPARSPESSGVITQCPPAQDHREASVDCPAAPPSISARQKLLMVLTLWRTRS